MSIPATQKVVLIEENGGPEVLKYTDFPVPSIGSTEILVKNKYAGVNFIEAYFRQGLYPSQKPYVLGREASGEVVAVGNSVKDFKVGDKVCYLGAATFAQYSKVSTASNIFKLPADASEADLKVMGSVLVQGLTAMTFAELAYNIKKGDYILIYAAAGGVGQILVQLALAKGAHPIAVASTDAKLEIAKSFGAKYLINSSKDDVVAKVKEFTNGKGAKCAYDSVGKDTFKQTIDCLGTGGVFVSFGNASGPLPAFEAKNLPRNIFIGRPSVTNYFVGNKPLFEEFVGKLFDAYKKGDVKFNISKEFALKDYPEATKLLESRATTGKLTLKLA